MQIHIEPVAYFITWTVYGSFLQGDKRWWRKKGRGTTPPCPELNDWHRARLKHEVILLDRTHRDIIKNEIEYHCENRGWKLWVANPRTNHVHVIVTAPNFSGDKVRDQLKANCTRGLRQIDRRFIERPVWTTKGDVQWLKTEDDLEMAISYASETQDRMGRGK